MKTVERERVSCKKKETKEKKDIKKMNVKGNNVTLYLLDFTIQGDNSSSVFYLLLNIQVSNASK